MSLLLFASAFWYLDELGESAKKSIQVHCRQALVGGHYGLTKRLGDRLVPRPDFFATKLWASLMGPRVLSAQIRDPSITGSATRPRPWPTAGPTRTATGPNQVICRLWC